MMRVLLAFYFTVMMVLIGYFAGSIDAKSDCAVRLLQQRNEGNNMELPEELNDPAAVLNEIRTSGDPARLPLSHEGQLNTVTEVLSAVDRLIRRRRKALGIPEIMHR